MEESDMAYQSYLLRLWQDPAEGELTWRASLENPTTGEMEGFQDLDHLIEGLRQRTEEGLAEDEGD